ncbi:bifunctional helix-turn-helix transcriptional regulator/GNAT family N-acetyltransferase [Salmonella enterica subsp. enterica serovar Ohio]|nr:bifunctional helix-turn-helix transcriptional regulator/GNAT family N-acetyltransferase [Salmonella enterica subsp. enterica serovar Ohio]EHH6251637.1 bifunctional helix-turn-helix transcriptional regulator/GNAT family N-acetyltransferase [Salmonella enterica]EHK0948527.1 bifunctional helix-turn-helix transcriptional regulator/GNAT family N-acetyltransferase [Citrobacter farmeri]EIW8473983.1 GNAT family N-acetyltransferase [Klebsiella pneumoniae]EKW0745508.1 bifunctional helix-turn-helix tra
MSSVVMVNVDFKMGKDKVREFRAALREMVRELGMLSRKSSGTELSPLQSHILIELDREALGATELAARLCVEKASMSRTLRRLIEDGHLLRIHDMQDGRASTFALSDSGKQVLLSLEENADKFTQEALASSSDKEVEEFFRTITGFSHSLRNARRQREVGLTFRTIEASDNAAIAEVIRNSFRENQIDHLEGVSLHDPELESLSDVYRHPGSGYWVAEAKGKIVGGAGFAPLFGETGICEMQKLFFSSDIKGMGIGRRMIAFIMSQAASMGYQACYLETLHQLKDAIRLYEAFGFDYLSERLGNTGHHSCNVYMLKKL